MVVKKHPPGKGKNRDQYNGRSIRVAATGTLVGASETTVAAGGATLILTVSSGIWLPADAGFDDQRQNILDGITGTGDIDTAIAATSEEAVVRTSDTVVTITIAASDYDIAEGETVSVAVPASAFYLTDTPRITTRTPSNTPFSITVHVPVPASEGPLYAGTIVEAAGISNTWTDEANLGADDGSDATCNMAGGGGINSNTVIVSNFGFDIPTGATITGIIAEIERFRTDGGGGQRDLAVNLTKDANAPAGDNKASATTWPTSAAVATYGADDDLWGTTWTPAEVNASGFGLRFAVRDLFESDTANVDYIRLTVHYTE